MLSFVTGTLEKNETEEDMGNVFLRWLTIRLANNTVIKRIFDNELISSPLKIGKMYEFVLLVSPPRPSPEAKVDAPRSVATWNGVIIDIAWQTSQLNYQFARSDFPDKSVVVLESEIGHVVSTITLLSRYTTVAPAIGNSVKWNKDQRVDLLAINELA